MRTNGILISTVVTSLFLCGAEARASNPADINNDNKVDWVDVKAMGEDWLSAGQTKVVSGEVYSSADGGNTDPYCDTHSADSHSQIDYSGGLFSVRTKPGRDMSSELPVRQLRVSRRPGFGITLCSLTLYNTVCYNQHPT
ncbi:MAG: hypothetical protein ACYTEQ_21315 [Planctomycetota bacterium]|jgi:hypothetical protein